ncbi:hypothetical protein K474DRAFT_1648072 [Panus rudis PR-1116 ss-1]|nr:hypothetical protein K474DRAFT_1648072 [Panus rudis PR-1116 ss-1]
MYRPNPYDQPPDFRALADAYIALKPHLKEIRSGVTIDFHDPNAVRCLTEALLHRDFDLSMTLPENRLCPPVTITRILRRVNYILLLEHIVSAMSLAFGEGDRSTIFGLDIGTGASAIYPLLGCRRNKNWHFTATEVDEVCAEYASKNINQNRLHDRITLVRSRPSGPIFPMESTSITYDFTMCNPPFYCDREEVLRSAEAKEVGPNAVCTGADIEMITPGGEAGFVRRMIEESVHYPNRCRWYTSMLGKMSSLTELVKILHAKKIQNYGITELVQGTTKRWVIAWSFTDAHLPDSLGRIANPALQTIMPSKNTLKHTIPFITSEDDIHIKLAQILTNVEGLKTRPSKTSGTETESPPGVIIEAIGNTWSRAARRKKLTATSQRGDSAGQSVPQLVCHIAVNSGQDKAESQRSVSQRVELIFQWLRGCERTLFESFVSHICRKVDSSLSTSDAERMDIA